MSDARDTSEPKVMVVAPRTVVRRSIPAAVPTTRRMEVPRHPRTPARASRIKEERINTLADYMSLVGQLQNESDVLWYRGIGDASYSLVPSLFRHPKAKTHSELRQLESRLNEAFRNRSIPFAPVRFNQENDWDQLFYMQHYRIPTRLLDWSFSPLVGLYFAVTSAKSNKEGKFESEAAVYVLNPREWNRATLKHLGNTGQIVSVSDPEAKWYRPSQIYEHDKKPPLAVQGALNSPRIVAQKGAFTVFGPTIRTMEDEFESNSEYAETCIVKVLIPPEHIAALKTEIFRAGVSESTIYPDLEGLAHELFRENGFK